MEKLTIGPDGRLTIPSEIIRKHGLHPGDELALVDSADGLLVYTGGVDPKTLAWWNSLTDDEKSASAAEARRYLALSEEERDRLWSGGVDAEAEEDNDEPDATRR